MQKVLLTAIILLLSLAFARAQAVSINTDASNPDPSAILDVKSTDKGMLVPRMSTDQRTTIGTPATGLLVYDTDTQSFWMYNGTAWTNLLTGNSGWSLNGNNATAANFIGTTNDQNLVFKTNNILSGKIDPANLNTFWGLQAGTATTTGYANAAVGQFALSSNTTGSSNVAIGFSPLRANTTGLQNVAIGVQALYANTIGSANTATGFGAMQLSNTGFGNAAHGYQALYSNSGGSYNTANGFNALNQNTSGIFNTASGRSALSSNTIGNSNTAAGIYALFSNTDRSNLVAVGDSALFNNGTGATEPVHATFNTALGSKALFSNTTGFRNTAIGRNALFNNTSGFYNTATGPNALFSNVTGSDNVANGTGALGGSMTGSNNVAVGSSSMEGNTSGGGNTAVGRLSLNSNTTGSNNTALGYGADVLSDNLSNAIAIGYNAKAGCDNCMVLGGTGGNAVKVGIGTPYPNNSLTVSGDFAVLQSIKLFFVPTWAGASGTIIGGVFDGLGQGPQLRFQGVGGAGLVDIGNDYLGNFVVETNDVPMMTITNAGNTGIGRIPLSNRLEVEGEASKTTPGSWLANSDARLKKNITPLNAEETLRKMLALQGVSYEWNDDKTGSHRPGGIQYGFTAQNIREVYPTLVQEDKLGYLQTAYGTYDAMTVEAIRALYDKIEALEAENATLKVRLDNQSAQLQHITAALKGAGISVTEQ